MAWVGCTPDAPTQPPADPPAAASAGSVAISAEQLATVNAGVEDAGARLLPSLKDAVKAAQLHAMLRDLSTQLADGDASRARRTLARARAAVRDGDGHASAPDLAAIELVLDRAAAVLDEDAAPDAP
jgi:hypothetical protein